MPRIEKFFANQKVADWTSGSVGAAAGGGGVIAIGGDTSIYPNPSGGYFQTHTITSTGNFTMASGTVDAEIIVIGGGGGGTNNPSTGYGPGSGVAANGGGGGAGAYVEMSPTPLSPTGGPGGNGVYPIVIGAGGAMDNDGNDTTGFGTTGPGGGRGGFDKPAPGNGNPGASGLL